MLQFSCFCSDDEDDFHDAVADPDYAQFSLSCPPPKHKRSGSSVSGCRLVFLLSLSCPRFILLFCSTRSDGVASSCAGGDEDDFSSDGEGPTLNIVKKREKQANTDQVDGSPNGSSNLTPVKQRFACVCFHPQGHMPISPQVTNWGQATKVKSAGQTRHLLLLVEHHEEQHRQGPLQDSHPCQLLRAPFLLAGESNGWKITF